MSIYHPTGITVEIVGIEAVSNGRSCYQHDVCGTLVEEDVVLRLRKVQILNSLGREETAIAAYHVSDGIDQCRVGFLQRHFVAHASTFDGVLAQVTEMYSVGSDSPIKRKKWRHNMGCCLAALISDFPPAAKHIPRKATSSFLAKLAKGKEDGAEEMALLTRLEEGKEGGVVASNDKSGEASEGASTRRNRNVPPTAGFTSTTRTDAPNQSAKKRTLEVTEINDKLRPSSKHGNRIAEKKMASVPKNVAPQRKEAPISPAKRREVIEINEVLDVCFSDDEDYIAEEDSD